MSRAVCAWPGLSLGWAGGPSESYPSKTVPQAIPARKTGSLSLFLLDTEASEEGNLYARLRLCRGFLDDLNRILPIRMRIRIESDIADGRSAGRMDAAGDGRALRWEFLPD
jgi:hypothetical protein